MRTYFIFILVLIAQLGSAQNIPADTSIHTLQIYEGFDLPSNYHSEYRKALRRVRRVYPLALHAAHVLDSLDQELESTKRSRKQKRIARKTHRDLKEDFKFLLKELYVSEGVVLTKLIYRETGKTVKEIIADYKGDAQAAIYTGMAGLFEQDLEATYNPNKEDFILECVINDIQEGKVEFDSTFVIVDREHYRNDRKEYKQGIRERKKRARKRKRKARRKERQQKRSETDENKKSED